MSVGAGASLPWIVELSNTLFSYRPIRANVTLDGSDRVELIVNEKGFAEPDDLTQTTEADRMAWSATSGPLATPGMSGDALTKHVIRNPSWLGDVDGASDVVMYVLLSTSATTSSTVPAGFGASGSFQRFCFERDTRLIALRQDAAATYAVGTTGGDSDDVWVETESANAGEISIRDSLGGEDLDNTLARTVTVNRVTIGGLWTSSGIFRPTDDTVSWWFGGTYTDAEQTLIRAHLDTLV